jgi:ubiquinone/menaquinone biosynthesis C-methylase UbiE
MSPEGSKNDRGSWSGTSRNYHSNVGQSSLLAASRLVGVANGYLPFVQTTMKETLSTTSQPPDEASSMSSFVLDVGSGTGAVTLTVANEFPSVPILATDNAAGMLDILSSNLSSDQKKHVETRVVDAHNLSELVIKPGHSGTNFSHIFASFMLHYTKSHLDVIKEMTTVLRPGGVIGIANWTLPIIDVYTIWKRACHEIDPLYEMPNPFDSSAWETEEEIQDGLASFGFGDIRTELIEMPLSFPSAEAYAKFWFEGQNPGAARVVEEFHGDDRALRRKKVEEVVRRDYQDGKAIFIRGTLGWGRKP